MLQLTFNPGLTLTRPAFEQPGPGIDPRGLQCVTLHCLLCKKSIEMNLLRKHDVQLEQS